jgi:hypothetical protein
MALLGGKHRTGWLRSSLVRQHRRISDWYKSWVLRDERPGSRAGHVGRRKGRQDPSQAQQRVVQ